MVTQPLSRRKFLGATAAAGAGLVLASSAKAFGQSQPKAPSAPSPNSKLNVALIGAGAEGRILLESLLRIGGIQVVAIVDIWEYARTYVVNQLKTQGVTVRSYENYEDLLAHEKELHAAVVATPDFWHAPITNACLEAGLDVYCEKMMSNTIEGARSMVQTMRRKQKLLQIGHQRRSNPRYIFALNRLIQDAKLCGRITAAQAQWNRAASDDLGWAKKTTIPPETLKKYGFVDKDGNGDMHRFRNWRWFKGLGGGMLSDLGAHQIDIFNWWLGKPAQSVIASGGVDYYKNHDWYDNAMVIYEYPMAEGVVRAFYQVQTTTSAGGGYFESFMGDQGCLKMSEDPSITAVFREKSAPSWKDLFDKNYLRAVMVPAPLGEGDRVDARATAQLAQYQIPISFNKAIHQPHLENFFNAVRGTAKLNCPADEAYRSEYVIHKANEAIEQQKRIAITPEETEVKDS